MLISRVRMSLSPVDDVLAAMWRGGRVVCLCRTTYTSTLRLYPRIRAFWGAPSVSFATTRVAFEESESISARTFISSVPDVGFP